MTGETVTAHVAWPDDIEEILDSDLTAALAYNLPAGGVALAVVAPVGLQNRVAGTVAFTTSLGFGRKLDRIAADNRVALAFHTREHGFSTLPGFVLIQGRATRVEPVAGTREESLTKRSERYLGAYPKGRAWQWWLRAYLAERVLVTVEVERVTVTCGETPTVVAGRPVAPPPAAQTRPVSLDERARRAATRTLRRLATLPNPIIGYRDSEGYPVVGEVQAISVTGEQAIVAGRGLPAGGRRVALLAHRYRPQLIGLETRSVIGWLEVREDSANGRFQPRRGSGFYAPPSKRLLLLSNGFLSRRGLRRKAVTGPAVTGRPGAAGRRRSRP